MSSLLDVMTNVPADDGIWAATESLALKLDHQGLVLPLTDLVLACCALQAKALLLTSDQHFRHVPDLRHQESLPSQI